MDVLLLVVVAASIAVTANLFFRKPIRWTDEAGPAAEPDSGRRP
jgi:hypothetical protein